MNIRQNASLDEIYLPDRYLDISSASSTEKVYIFSDIDYGLDGTADFYIDVSIKYLAEGWIVRDNPLVCDFYVFSLNSSVNCATTF